MSLSTCTDRSHNTPGALPTRYSMEMEDRVMEVLPRALSDWLRYESTEDICPVSIFREWRNGLDPNAGGMSVEDLLSSLQSVRRSGTRNTYGIQHPQSRLS